MYVRFMKIISTVCRTRLEMINVFREKFTLIKHLYNNNMRGNECTYVTSALRLVGHFATLCTYDPRRTLDKSYPADN